MVCITTHKFLFFTRKEIWFYQNEDVQNGTYTAYCYCATPLPQPFTKFLPEKSARIDLSLSIRDLFSRLNRTYRYQVLKAQRMNFKVQIIERPGYAECQRFLDLFNGFARAKGISAASPRRIFALQRSGNLTLTSVKKNNEEVVIHLYIHDTKVALLLHTFHLNVQSDDYERGIANKFLHWNDIIHFKQRGMLYYDLGGINYETVPGISKFKMDLGGELYDVFNYIRVSALIKPLYRLLRR